MIKLLLDVSDYEEHLLCREDFQGWLIYTAAIAQYAGADDLE